MTASNCGVCPKCKVEYDSGTKILSDKVDDAYGNVPAEEYLRLLGEFSARPSFEDTDEGYTLREDYGIRITDEGLFFVSYEAACTKCGFSHKYEYEEVVYPCDVQTAKGQAKSRK